MASTPSWRSSTLYTIGPSLSLLLLLLFFHPSPAAVWLPHLFPSGNGSSSPGNGWPMRSRHPMTTSTPRQTRSLYNRYLSLKAFLSCSSSLLDWSSSLSGHYLLASGSVTQKKKEKQNLFFSFLLAGRRVTLAGIDHTRFSNPPVRGCDGQQNVVYIYIYICMYIGATQHTAKKWGVLLAHHLTTTTLLFPPGYTVEGAQTRPHTHTHTYNQYQSIIFHPTPPEFVCVCV